MVAWIRIIEVAEMVMRIPSSVPSGVIWVVIISIPAVPSAIIPWVVESPIAAVVPWVVPAAVVMPAAVSPWTV